MPTLSEGFQQLYCDPALFDTISIWHPISLKRALPFHPQVSVADDPYLINAELAFLADKNDDTRRGVIDAYARGGLLSETDAASVISVIDFFGADFFDLMGLVYANAGIYVCALRWYREHIIELETQDPEACSDAKSVYASVGYCLYALGMFEEAIAWTKSCIGPRLIIDTVTRALIGYEAQQVGGALRAIERSGSRARITIAASDPAAASQIGPRLKTALETLAPSQEFYLDWIDNAKLPPPAQEGYPFQVELDGGNFLRHKMNLLFALCGAADALLAKGCTAEAWRLLSEADALEPNAAFIQERIEALG
jgi:tetratricopeptide (TPR) repeat protein